MDEMKKIYTIATPEMVSDLIEEYYAVDSEKVESLLKDYAVVKKCEVNIEQIVSDTLLEREKLAENVSCYEDELVRMLDLATALSEMRCGKDDDRMEQYINYLLEKNKEILPDIIEIIQLLKKY